MSEARYVTVACMSRTRWFDLDAERTAHKTDPAAYTGNGYSKGNPEGIPGNESMPGNPAGAPPLDCWTFDDDDDPPPTTTEERPMSEARYMVGDVFERMAELPDASIDLIVTSPPFLALRSYLPADHPDKHREIGSEATPAAFLSTLLALTREWRRVLAPHGSLCVELGDSFSGSGGAGGDYDDDGWRDGQPRFGGSASRTRESRWSEADALWLAGVIDTEGSIMVHRQERPGNNPSYRTDVCISMMDREVCDRAAEIAGVGNVNRDGRQVYAWHVSAQQARYVLTNIWPHLLIKKRHAMAAIELQRHIEEAGARGRYNTLTVDELGYREMIREYVSGLNARGEDRGKYVPTWTPPTPLAIAHEKARSIGWPMPKSLCLIPGLYAASLAYGTNLLDHSDTVDPWRIRNLVVWHRPNPPVGALGDKVRPSTSYITTACTSRTRWFDLDAERTPHARDYSNEKPGGLTEWNRNGMVEFNRTIVADPAGAPPLDCWRDIEEDVWTIPTAPYKGAHYATFPPALPRRLINLMCPRQVCLSCGEPRRRITAPTAEYDAQRCGGDFLGKGNDRTLGLQGQRLNGRPNAEYETLGWSDCGHDTWRRGVVLDPFAGSGTTLQAASELGRNSIGIDLDETNLELARQRLGMFLTEEEVPA